LLPKNDPSQNCTASFSLTGKEVVFYFQNTIFQNRSPEFDSGSFFNFGVQINFYIDSKFKIQNYVRVISTKQIYVLIYLCMEKSLAFNQMRSLDSTVVTLEMTDRTFSA